MVSDQTAWSVGMQGMAANLDSKAANRALSVAFMASSLLLRAQGSVTPLSAVARVKVIAELRTRLSAVARVKVIAGESVDPSGCLNAMVLALVSPTEPPNQVAHLSSGTTSERVVPGGVF